MIYIKRNRQHSLGFSSTEPPQSFELYANELEALAEFAATKNDMREMAAILKRLAEYGRTKADRGRGPTRFRYE